MHEEPFQPEDLRLINLILPHYPDVVDVIRAVRQAVARVTYPIRDFDELATALGGVTIAGGAFSVADAQRLLPPYYFPIGSEEDLIAKVADLRAQAGGLAALPAVGDVTWITPTEGPPENSRPPEVALADVPTDMGCAGMKKAAHEAPDS
jgi:hypothetical protein